MRLAIGSQNYTHGAPPVSANAFTWTQAELDFGLSGPVKAAVFDDSGLADIAAMLASVASTEFDHSDISKALLLPAQEPESWRVGEAIAETYLTSHRDCMFPWPDGRDVRKSGSSLPGADLVGFRADGASHSFAFGEVKTSSETKYPPGAMYGQTGLKQQLEDLRDSHDIRQDLMRYLAHRALRASWRNAFVQAFTRFSKNSADVSVFGVLIRDVQPDAEDLRARTSALGKSPPNGISIELIALYLPVGCIPGLGKKVLDAHLGGGA